MGGREGGSEGGRGERETEMKKKWKNTPEGGDMGRRSGWRANFSVSPSRFHPASLLSSLITQPP